MKNYHKLKLKKTEIVDLIADAGFFTKVPINRIIQQKNTLTCRNM